MRLKDLLNEMEEAAAEAGAVPTEPVPQQTIVLQQNFVRIDMVHNEITRIFGQGNEPQTDFDDQGMFIILDDAQKRDYDSTQDKGVVFTLPEQPFIVDEMTNVKSFRIMFLKIEEPEETTAEPAEGAEGTGEPKIEEGWKGVVGGLLAVGAIGTAVVNTPPTYVDGERYEYATATPPKEAKLVTDDNGKNVYIWTSPRMKNSHGRAKDNLYRPK